MTLRLNCNEKTKGKRFDERFPDMKCAQSWALYDKRLRLRCFFDCQNRTREGIYRIDSSCISNSNGITVFDVSKTFRFFVLIVGKRVGGSVISSQRKHKVFDFANGSCHSRLGFAVFAFGGAAS